MAGSLTWRLYESEQGKPYSIPINKRNASGYQGTTGYKLCEVRDANYPLLPLGLVPRYICAYNYSNSRQRRRFIVGNRVVTRSASWLNGSDYIVIKDTSGTEILWIVSSIVGESIIIPRYIGVPDTGLTDGTVSL
jgi:hypothetical protein